MLCHFLLTSMVSQEKTCCHSPPSLPPLHYYIFFSLLSRCLICLQFSEICTWHIRWGTVVLSCLESATLLECSIIFCQVWVKFLATVYQFLKCFPAMPSSSSSSRTPMAQMLPLCYDTTCPWSSVHTILVCFISVCIKSDHFYCSISLSVH